MMLSLHHEQIKVKFQLTFKIQNKFFFKNENHENKPHEFERILIEDKLNVIQLDD